MIKKILMPKVVVYRNVIDNIDEIFEIIKKSQSDSNNLYFIKKWQSWNDNGLMSNADLNVEDKHEILKTEIGKLQYESLIKLENAFWDIIEDYILDWKNVGKWPYVKKWEIERGNNSAELVQTDQNLLMYYPDLSKRLAMSYHTDNHQYDIESKGWKLFITITVYINDNYSDGELSFIDEESKKIIYYKPKAGDITVFPSMLPYFHGVEPISSGEKYLSRMFVSLYYEGSENWKENAKIYGEENIVQMQKEINKKDWNNPKYFRVPVFLDDDVNDNLLKEALGKQIVFPFNKQEAKEKFLVRWDNEI